MKINARELKGDALDWAVARTEGWLPHGDRGDLYKTAVVRGVEIKSLLFPGKHLDQGGMPEPRSYSPSTDWSQGGPLIEQHAIELHNNIGEQYGEEERRYAVVPISASGSRGAMGPTPLVAAMRALVFAKLGDQIEVPEELARA